MNKYKLYFFLAIGILSLNTVAQDESRRVVTPNEWRSYIESWLPLSEEGMAKMEERFDIENPQLRQEYYRHLVSLISYSYFGLMSTDAEYPDFMPSFKAQNFAAPNPDDAYYLISLYQLRPLSYDFSQ